MQKDQQTHDNVLPIKIEKEMRSSYLDYAMSVIVGRALPDVRDGLKPVHRRILYAMYVQKNTYRRAYKKSARIVGDVIGKYHPHGDVAVYDSLVRMAQDFSMRVPLVDGQGNFGSVDGDPPAAMRYTEVRMTKIMDELLADLEKDTVNFGPNYDDSEQEPLVLPTRVPNLLINGSEGIAVGMATKIPPHNLGEVLDATLLMLDNPQASLDDILAVIPGPDFPTAAIMYDTDGIREAYETGKGSLKLRARSHVETKQNGKPSIIVTELPYQVNKARLLEKIALLVRKKKLEGITDLRDESNRKGMRVVIELRRDANVEVVKNQLYQLTKLDINFKINQLAIVNGQPKVLGIREILSLFIDFRRDVITRRTLFEQKKAAKRFHILNGIQRALEKLDLVIKTIRQSSDGKEAKQKLMRLLKSDEIQAQAILNMRLQRLTDLEMTNLTEESHSIKKQISYFNSILKNEEKLIAVIRDELSEIRKTYFEKRRTEIQHIQGDMNYEDLIPNDDEVITLTQTGYIKRTKLEEYRLQKRAGKGLKGMATKTDDFVDDVWVLKTHSSLLIFTTRGIVYKLKVYQLPRGGRNTRGKPIINLLQINENTKISAILPFTDFDQGGYIVTATRNGKVKKSKLEDYKNIHRTGIIGTKVRSDDELVSVQLCPVDSHILIASSSGKSVRFLENTMSPTGRATYGVRGIRSKKNEVLIGMVIISPEILKQEKECEKKTEKIEKDKNSSYKTLLTITQNGFGKRSFLHKHNIQNRGGLGLIAIRTSKRNGKLVAIHIVDSADEIFINTDGGKIIRVPVDNISIFTRNTQGVNLVSLGEKETVMGVALYKNREEEIEETEE